MSYSDFLNELRHEGMKEWINEQMNEQMNDTNWQVQWLAWDAIPLKFFRNHKHTENNISTRPMFKFCPGSTLEWLRKALQFFCCCMLILNMSCTLTLCNFAELRFCCQARTERWKKFKILSKISCYTSLINSSLLVSDLICFIFCFIKFRDNCRRFNHNF